MMTTSSSLSRIERSVVVRAPKGRVWRALTTPAEFSKWFQVEIDGAFEPGARVRMTTTHPEFAGLVFYIAVERMEPERLFSWRWHPGSEQPADDSTEPMTLVMFELEEADAGTRVKVVETGFDAISLARRAKVLAENTQGWEEQLAALQKYAGEEV